MEYPVIIGLLTMLGLSVLYAQIKTSNQVSIAVAEKAGFKKQSIANI